MDKPENDELLSNHDTLNGDKNGTFSSDIGVTVRLIPINRWELTRNYCTLYIIVPPTIPIV